MAKTTSEMQMVPKTKAGVIAFQTAAGVKVDGIVGPVTQGALTAMAASADKNE